MLKIASLMEKILKGLTFTIRPRYHTCKGFFLQPYSASRANALPGTINSGACRRRMYA